MSIPHIICSPDEVWITGWACAPMKHGAVSCWRRVQRSLRLQSTQSSNDSPGSGGCGSTAFSQVMLSFSSIIASHKTAKIPFTLRLVIVWHSWWHEAPHLSLCYSYTFLLLPLPFLAHKSPFSLPPHSFDVLFLFLPWLTSPLLSKADRMAETLEVCTLTSDLSNLGLNLLFQGQGASLMRVVSPRWTLNWTSRLPEFQSTIKNPMVSFVDSR